MYLKTSGHYCEVITTSGNIILHDKNLDKLLQILPNTFERIHRSYAVVKSAMCSIRSEKGSKYWLILKNGVTLPIGRIRVKLLINRLI
ncbi:MAG: LytTR family transcriptional regulator DNA-binding domain-containing protein [Colwellia sp.]|nr:LytTR family transcriptional regulator DNA-binding domain-containing protein [Colwellia sp.]